MHDGSYYDLPPDCKTLQDVIVKKEMCYTRGNIMKAVYRWETKGLVYNLEKIKWFAEDALRRLYAEEKQRAIDERILLQVQNPEDTRLRD